jgi:hypothetical protein
MPPERPKSKSNSARARKRASSKPKTPRKKRPRKTAKRRSAAPPATAMVMSVAANQQLGADQVAQILADCVPKADGNNSEIVLGKTLESYGFHFQNQVDTLTAFIIGNANFGVGRYGFHLSGDALNFAVPSTTLSDLADAIEDKATPSP